MLKQIFLGTKNFEGRNFFGTLRAYAINKNICAWTQSHVQYPTITAL